MREWKDVEFNGADDLAPHLRVEDGVILVNHASLLAAMSRTDAADWAPIASPDPSRPYLWFASRKDALTGRVEDERGSCWSANIFDSATAKELATLSCPLDESLLVRSAA